MLDANSTRAVIQETVRVRRDLGLTIDVSATVRELLGAHLTARDINENWDLLEQAK